MKRQGKIILPFLFLFLYVFPIYSQSSFNPSTISGLQLWLKPDTGIIIMGSNIQTWQDQSGLGNDAIQPSTTFQPLYVPSVINGYGGARFDDIDDGMQTGLSLTTDSFSIFVLYKYLSSLSAPRRSIQGGNNWLLGPYTGSYQLYTGGFVAGPPIDSAKFVIQSGLLRPSIVYNFVNGVLYGTLPNPTYPGLIGLGASGSQTSQTLDGYILEVIVYNTFLQDSLRLLVEQYLSDKYAPPVNLGADVTVCDTIYISKPNSKYVSYLWSTGATSDSIVVTQSGVYSVEVMNIFDRISSDTINISGIRQKPILNLYNDTTICLGDTLKWNTQLDKAEYDFLWQDSSTDSVFYITQSGQYYVQVTDTLGCSFYSDTITITIDTFPLIALLGNDTTICSGNYIALQQGTSQTASWLWSDSTTNPTLTITSPGNYWVTVTDSLGCTASDTINIFIKGMAPIAGFTATAPCLGDNTTFTDTSSTPDSANIISRLWDFGDDSTSTIQNPTHLYDSAGNYNVTLTVVTDSGCSASAVKTVVVHVLPQANFNPVLGCSGAGVYFNDLSSVPAGSLTGWEWDFGDPSSGVANFDTLQNPTHIFADSGNYNVKLKVFTNNGCTDSLTQVVSIKLSPVAGFSYPPACDGEFVTFTDTSTTVFPWSITGWSWNFGDSYTSALSNPAHLYADTGIYNVSLIVQALDGCIDTVVEPVIVNPSPVAIFTGSDLCLNTPHQFIDSSYIAGGIITSWYWDFGGVGASTYQNPLFAFSDTGSFPINLTVTSSAGCTNSITDTAEVRKLPAVNFNFTPAFGTPPLTVSFTNQSAGAISYNWDFGDGNTSIAQNPTNLYADTGIYQIELNAFDIYGCRDSIVKTIKVIRTILDIAVVDVVTTLQSNYLTVSANLFNSGTRDINSLELHAQINGGTAIREDWAGVLLPGQKTTYDFTAGFVLPVNFDLRYICVSALNPNNDNDDVPSNNEQCVIFSEGFIALEPYPNPTDNEINIEYIIPYSEFVEVVLYDAIGKKVAVLFSDIAKKGLNKLLVNSAILNSGMYVYKISFIDKTEVKKFVVSQ